MKSNTTQILKFLYLLSWIIFIGVCIEAGAFLFNTFFRFFIDPTDASLFWQEVDLTNLYDYDHGYYLLETSLMSIVAILRAWIFYLIVKLLHDKKLNLLQPFNEDVRRFISNIAYLSMVIGLFSLWGAKFAKWLIEQGLEMPDMEDLRLGGADVWLFMGVILFIISQIFKKGIEIQTENELTI
jgi:ABC-type antimicrobial peptide transport system permease subunit